ncbi:MAG: hypothetical protein UY92_C0009G0056 [Candidatus Magasanikbacteria bacterium GW2011_GWA2_56_11]|uniref:Uncharacterized protein n=1 Tax=Candidatus Magasanikbacteria bacterium GW2011_GWA2_56_11 TaxID=1619044 RepID=A0A0G2ALR5_9BACT|nr:MAG: hypothetical protein UY92_C0009G0056 [Candidatus Magasanikbacteria bacterium GW2011_GWA2_56_11]
MHHLETKQFLPRYFVADWPVTASSVRKLAEAGRRISVDNPKLDTVWQYARQITDFLATAADDPENFVLEPWERQVISLVETQPLEEAVSELAMLEQSIAKANRRGGAELSSGGLAEAVTLSAENLDFLKLGDDVRAEWQPFVQHIYSLEEFQAKTAAWEDLNVARLARSAVELSAAEHKKDAAQAILSLCLSLPVNDATQYTWEEAFLLTVFIQVVYRALPQLSEDDRISAVKNFFYRAIMLGVPVRQICAELVYDTDTPISYALEHRSLSQALADNVEKVVLSLDGPVSRPWSDTLSEYRSRARGGQDETNSAREYALDLYPEGAAEPRLREWYAEMLDIFVHLEKADLVPHNRGGELAPDEAYHNDLVQLIAWFGVGEAARKDLVGYFQTAGARVPLAAFHKSLEAAADLSQDTTVENALAWADALRSAGLLGPDEEILEFHENDGRFHWRRQLTA